MGETRAEKTARLVAADYENEQTFLWIDRGLKNGKLDKIALSRNERLELLRQLVMHVEWAYKKRETP